MNSLSNMYHYEYTDTFAGEANYTWIRKGEFEAKNLNHAVRLAKKAVGLNGVNCRRRESYGDMVVLRPYGQCTILFIYWTEK